ncbi:MAG TPA: acyl-[acyl-carrier-protein]--UDP-N-acetylglucosamine O-acyltransferase, partial [Thermoanaerobaculia bacterium]
MAAIATTIHPMAHVDPAAELGEGVQVGPFAFVGAGVQVGDRTEIGSGAHLNGPLVLGSENRVFPGACLGFDPQDLKYKGETTRVEIGDRNLFREHCTVHRGTVQGGGVTRIGSGNLFMVFTHVAHDCQVGNGTVFGNNATLAGHVEVHDFAVINAFTSIH